MACAMYAEYIFSSSRVRRARVCVCVRLSWLHETKTLWRSVWVHAEYVHCREDERKKKEKKVYVAVILRGSLPACCTHTWVTRYACWWWYQDVISFFFSFAPSCLNFFFVGYALLTCAYMSIWVNGIAEVRRLTRVALEVGYCYFSGKGLHAPWLFIDPRLFERCVCTVLFFSSSSSSCEGIFYVWVDLNFSFPTMSIRVWF